MAYKYTPKPPARQIYRLDIRLDAKHQEKLLRNVKLAGLTKTAYIKHLITGYKVKPLPDREYKGLYTEINKIGHNINQITRLCNEGEEPISFKEQLLFYMSMLYKLLDSHL